MKFLSFLSALILTAACVPAHAGFQGINGTTSLGVFNKLTCSTGLTCTKSKDAFSIVSSPSIVGSPLSATAAASTASILDLIANGGATNGDKWEIQSTVSQGGLKFLNNTSGSLVQKMLLDTSGNLTVAGTATITGAFSPSGGLAASATTRTIFASWHPDVVTSATSATPSSTAVQMTQLWIPHNMTLTGVGVLNAATCGTNKWIVAIFDSSGNALANSATAGTLCSGASAYQKIAFTAPYVITGPRTLWIGVYADGATDRYYAVPTTGQADGLAGTVSAQTFGTVAAVTLPTTFTAGVGPVAYVY
jgi:hypothetical protein